MTLARLFFAGFIAGCAAHSTIAPVAPAPAPPDVELVESAPLETTLDHPDIPNASDVWLDMIRGARTSLDVAEFYISDSPGSRLAPVIDELERAADRGVRVRILIEQIFYSKYPESVDRLAAHAGIALRHFDMHATMGGILHAKYFVVDRREAYVGSQNFDWRSLEHIQEMGVRVRKPDLASQLDDLFSADWDVTGGAPPTRWAQAWHGAPATSGVFLGMSPTGYLPNEATWDLPLLLGWIDGAKRNIDIQVLTYKPAMRDGSPFVALDDALRRAMSRGVRVRLLVSSWGQKDEGLRALASAMTPPSEVRIITIPAFSKGDIPFGRVAHAKYAIVDGRQSWVGTSNWEGDYFEKSRNVSVFVTTEPFATRLDGVFDDGWSGAYATKLREGDAL